MAGVAQQARGEERRCERTGSSFARDARVVSARLHSSLETVYATLDTSPVSLFFTAIVVSIGTISSSKRLAACAAAVRCCERSEYSSCRSRDTPYRSATRSAVSIIGIHNAGNVFINFFSTTAPLTIFGWTSEIESRPPPIAHGVPSTRIACAALATACRPEEQKRLMVVPDVVTGHPAHSAAFRAMFIPVSPSGIPARSIERENVCSRAR